MIMLLLYLFYFIFNIDVTIGSWGHWSTIPTSSNKPRSKTQKPMPLSDQHPISDNYESSIPQTRVRGLTSGMPADEFAHYLSEYSQNLPQPETPLGDPSQYSLVPPGPLNLQNDDNGYQFYDTPCSYSCPYGQGETINPNSQSIPQRDDFKCMFNNDGENTLYFENYLTKSHYLRCNVGRQHCQTIKMNQGRFSFGSRSDASSNFNHHQFQKRFGQYGIIGFYLFQDGTHPPLTLEVYLSDRYGYVQIELPDKWKQEWKRIKKLRRTDRVEAYEELKQFRIDIIGTFVLSDDRVSTRSRRSTMQEVLLPENKCCCIVS